MVNIIVYKNIYINYIIIFNKLYLNKYIYRIIKELAIKKKKSFLIQIFDFIIFIIFLKICNISRTKIFT